jgi:hypothetical protein
MDKKQHLQNIREAYSAMNRTRIERNTSAQVFFMWLILWGVTMYANYWFFSLGGDLTWNNQVFIAVVFSACVHASMIVLGVVLYKEWDNAIENHYYTTRDFNRLTYGMEVW